MKPLIVANWKMNPSTLKGARLLFNSVKSGLKNIKNTEVVICPPFLYLPFLLKTKTDNLKPKLGAQDCFWEEKGAYTGEVSPKMLKNLGIEYVIIGHSERRALGETDEMINKKIKAAISAKLKSILCIGETAAERKNSKTFKVLKEQLKRDLSHLPTQSLNNLSIAYEPIWAIGTGNFCEPAKAKEVLFFLRKIRKANPILYGGSVNSQNARDYIKVGFQGLLVGGASLDAEEFVKLIKNVSKT